jgi:LuxR family maltose regulon positive regulatory protein
MHMSEAESQSPTLIQTKLHRPRLRADLVERPRLLSQLECGIEHKLTLISAPAGYGKTTLLCQWLEDCAHPSAWLSLDENDSDLVVFVSYFVAAVQSAYPDACAGVRDLLHAPSSPPWEHMATVLVNELADLPNPLTLALDDYHYIHDPQIHQFLAQVIRYLPEQVHLAIASRTDPPLALDRLRAGRELAEIRARDLRFSEGETEAYLAAALDPALAEELAILLEERTEGWIVGLHLATLWLRGVENPTGALAGFGGDTTQFVAEYLASEVLSRQTARVRQFLLQTSILNRFCADLCDAVAGLPPGSSADLLDDLDRANLFLVSLGEPGGWYRYHHLFDEMLRAALHSRANAEEVAALHCRASDWFAAQGQIEEALHHALAAGDVESAVRLVEENAHNLLNRLERHTLERWLSFLPRDAVRQRPRLLVAQSWLLYRQSRMTALETILDDAEASLNRDEDIPDSADKRALWGQIHTLRSATAYLLHDDFERSLASAEQALLWLPITERGARSTALGFWALTQQAMGRQETAIHRLGEALTDPVSEGLAGTQVFLGLCLTYYMAGENQQMLGATHRFLDFATKLEQANAIVGSHWLAGYCHYELNDLVAAAQHFAQAVQPRYRSNFVATFGSTIGLARIYQVQDELEKAREMIVSLRTETLRLNNTDFLPALDSIQANQALLQGNPASALRWARTPSFGTRLESPFWFEMTELTLARILIAAGADKEVRAVRRALQNRLTAARSQHRVQRVVPILAHLALIHDRLRDVDEGLAALKEALGLAEPGGFIRSFVDAGPRLKELLLQIKQPGVNPHYLAEILAAFDEGPVAPPALPATDLDLLLTRREEEILRLMRDGLTNKEIANRLVISVHTVKRHATNIYTKLDVKSRREAVRKAQQSGIFPAN